MVFEGLLAGQKEKQEDPFEEDDIVDILPIPVFEHAKDAAQDIQSRRGALEEAIRMESRSIAFYEHVSQSVTDATTRLTFAKVIAEEKKHMMKFANLLRSKCLDSGTGCIL